MARPGAAAVIILVGAVMWFFAERQGDKVMIGDAQEGVAELRPEARYNQDAGMITRKFALGVDIINVIAEARPDACTLSYPTMELIDRFAWHLTNVQGVQQVITLPTTRLMARLAIWGLPWTGCTLCRRRSSRPLPAS